MEGLVCSEAEDRSASAARKSPGCERDEWQCPHHSAGVKWNEASQHRPQENFETG